MNPELPAGGRPARQVSAARWAGGLLALGVFAALISAVFLSPFAVSPYAIQNDVYMSNLFIGPPIAVLGLALFVIGVVLALRSPAGWRLWGRALLTAVLAAGALTIVYALFGGQYHSFGTLGINWPPYLNAIALYASAVAGLLVFLAGWLWAADGALVGHASASR